MKNVGEAATHQTVTIPDETVSVECGHIDIVLESLGSWADPAMQYSKARVGYRGHPKSPLILSVPVEGVEDGAPISPEQVAQLLEKMMETLLPACTVYVTAAAETFGYVEPDF